MKNLIKPSLFVIFILFSSNLWSQDCKMYFPSKEGTTIVYTNYNKKGKASKWAIYYEVVKVYDSAGYRVEKIRNWGQNKKRKSSPITFSVLCKGDNFLIDTKSYLDIKKLDAYKNMEIEFEGENINIPVHPVVGQKLKDGYINYKVHNNNFTLANMTVKITNRKVEALEKVSTPAGNFDTVKISFDLEIKAMGVTFKYKGVEWYAKNTGMVKRETWNKKGKLLSYSEITKILKN